jgi:hypothetical protein
MELKAPSCVCWGFVDESVPRLALIPPATYWQRRQSTAGARYSTHQVHSLVKASMMMFVFTLSVAKWLLGVRGLYSTEMEAIHLLQCDTSALCIQTIALLSSCVYGQGYGLWECVSISTRGPAISRRCGSVQD